MKYSELIKKIKEKRYPVIGIRSLQDDEQYKIGDICRYSYNWNHFFDRSTYGYENEELNGTSAINTLIDYFWDEDDEIEEKIEKTYKKAYWKTSVVLIAGYRFDIGEDDNEAIVEDAKVIFKF